jgi:hypothetical protein
MAENKTKETSAEVAAFIDGLADPGRRDDAVELTRILEELSGDKAAMWGSNIIGFGRYRYRYESGREGEMMRIGFSPRAKELVLYVMGGFPRFDELLARLGKHKTGKACLYIKRLHDVDQDVLRELVTASLAHVDATYPA